MLLADAADGARAVPQTGAGILDQNTLTQLQRAMQTCRGVVVVSLSATLVCCSPVAVVGALLPALGERAVMSGDCRSERVTEQNLRCRPSVRSGRVAELQQPFRERVGVQVAARCRLLDDPLDGFYC